MTSNDNSELPGGISGEAEHERPTQESADEASDGSVTAPRERPESKSEAELAAEIAKLGSSYQFPG